MLSTLSTSHPETLLAPFWAEVLKVQPETPGIATLTLRLEDAHARARYRFQPGQFNMLSLPGIGEAAISVSSDPEDPTLIRHTVRAVGNVSRALISLQPGARVGVRGPFGTPWPIAHCQGQDLLIVAGGIGLAPLRPVIYYAIHHREAFGKITVLYGARTPKDLLYTAEYDTWREHNIRLLLTVDRADPDWTGSVGVVPMLFYRLRPDPKRTVVFSCGPEIMMRFVVHESMARRILPERLYLSLERNMKCGQGLCGHCQFGPFFICRDGPVFRFDALAPFFNVEDL